MVRRALGLGLLGWCVLCSAGCRKPEPEGKACTTVSSAPSECAPARTVSVIDLEALAIPTAEAVDAEPPAPPEPPQEPEPLVGASTAAEEPPPPEDEDKAWIHAAARAAQAVDTSGLASKPLEQVTIATSSVDGRVKRVRPGTIEVSDGEGNVYELRLDGRSRGLRQGRHIPLRTITEGMRVRASFELVGDGESLARDIEIRR